MNNIQDFRASYFLSTTSPLDADTFSVPQESDFYRPPQQTPSLPPLPLWLPVGFSQLTVRQEMERQKVREGVFVLPNFTIVLVMAVFLNNHSSLLLAISLTTVPPLTRLRSLHLRFSGLVMVFHFCQPLCTLSLLVHVILFAHWQVVLTLKSFLSVPLPFLL